MYVWYVPTYQSLFIFMLQIGREVLEWESPNEKIGAKASSSMRVTKSPPINFACVKRTA